MNNPLGVSPSKGNQGTTRGKEKIFWPRTRFWYIFSLPRVVPWFPLLGLTPGGLFMGSISTLIYTSELILYFTICVLSATRHNIHMYPYFLFAAIHHLNRPRLSLSDLVAQSTRVTVDIIRRSWVRFPPRSKDFSLPRVVPWFPLLGLTPSGLFMV